METNPTVTSPIASPGAPAKHIESRGSLIDGDFQTFLVMLTTQMRNQDPLNPIDSTDYAQQLATFSGVEQQVKTNTLLEALSDQMGLSGMAQLASWVGMEARVTVPVEFSGTPLKLYPKPAADADQTVLVVHDSSGREVTREPVEYTSEPILWAGTDPSGTPLSKGSYSFRLESYREGELIGADPVEVYGRIAEVRTSDGGALLLLDGGSTVIPADVKGLRAASPN
ncbi:MAG: flagellar hook capping FlgD N-terminal domain-containing protein [Paracoccaceae bacterium]